MWNQTECPREQKVTFQFCTIWKLGYHFVDEKELENWKFRTNNDDQPRLVDAEIANYGGLLQSWIQFRLQVTAGTKVTRDFRPG